MKTLCVHLKNADYPVHISTQEARWLKPLRPLVGSHAVVITSRRVARFCLPELKSALKRQKIRVQVLFTPDGERNKNLFQVARLYHGLGKMGADRSTTILLLGGGVVGDMGGFAAATYLRGLPFIQIPTTLVGQVDSAIGGKLGVDLPEGKNLVGVFRQPQAVFCHIPFLRTLPEREIVGGLGEVIKYGIIRDPRLFQLVRTNSKGLLKRDPNLLYEIVRRSAQIKAGIVARDERETSGLRMILNFGHTFGHAIERLTQYRRFLHGEAVGLGMVIAARVSARWGVCSPEEAQAVEGAVKEAGLPWEPPFFTSVAWIRALGVDKKSLGGMIRFVFLKRIGEVAIRPVSPRELVGTFQECF